MELLRTENTRQGAAIRDILGFAQGTGFADDSSRLIIRRGHLHAMFIIGMTGWVSLVETLLPVFNRHP